MRIKCNRCGRIVSSEIKEEIILAAWVECGDCVIKDEDEKDKLKQKIKALQEERK